MAHTSGVREIERDGFLERIRARLRGLSFVEEQALLRSVDELVSQYTADHESDEERQLWIRNEERKAVGRRELMSGCLTFEEAAELLELSSHALRMRINRGKIISLRDGSDHFIPRWQFDLSASDRMVKGLDRVLKAMESASSDEMKILWLSRPWGGFEGLKPIDVLRSGRVDEVIEFAQSLGGGHE
ncbi:MAG TPA: hypothetical protein VE954_26875 [Oligoflexus sp.]|uniref:hypothetical protein n=1 Tax=Oligoflexus sp. TaxID=1971216 RepID=UPI002D3D8032|nr:hypothetical protein [Oligoflexus sp.]HYX36748.1 hypothetical protein [Oligoflexus sp.]